jgi:hypothetical protein
MPQVPELSAFLLITVFPSIPLLVFLTFVAFDALPADKVSGWPLVVFTFLEVWYAYVAVRRFIRSQTALFYRLVQEDSMTEGGMAGMNSGVTAVAPAAARTVGGSGAPHEGLRRRLAPGGASAGAGGAEGAALQDVGPGEVLAMGWRGLRDGVLRGGASDDRGKQA